MRLSKTTTILVFLLIGNSTFSQQIIDERNIIIESQWDGSTSTTGDIYRTGNVGIGTTSPSQKLTVQGNLRLQGGTRYLYFNGGDGYIGTEGNNYFYLITNNTIRMLIRNDGQTFFPQGTLTLGKTTVTGTDYIRFGYDKGFGHSYFDFGGNMHFRSLTNGMNADPPLVLQRDGNVVIGGKLCYDTYIDQAKGYKLAVYGKVIAEEVVVKLRANWPDYVFLPEYKLRTLSEVEQHIQTHGHLPDVPDAQTVEKNGIGVGEMNAILLKKIEELTLYVIEQQKQIEELSGMVTGKDK